MSENNIEKTDENTASIEEGLVSSIGENNEGALVFRIGSNLFSVDILTVQTLIHFSGENITPVPNAPDYVAGVINLRGSIVPIIHTAKSLGVEDYDQDNPNLVAVVLEETDDKGVSKMVGFIVDEMKDVSNVNPSDISEIESNGDSIEGTNSVRGVLSIGEDKEMVTALDVKNLIFGDVIENFKGFVEGIA